jgi:hypothetical protein
MMDILKKYNKYVQKYSASDDDYKKNTYLQKINIYDKMLQIGGAGKIDQYKEFVLQLTTHNKTLQTQIDSMLDDFSDKMVALKNSYEECKKEKDDFETKLNMCHEELNACDIAKKEVDEKLKNDNTADEDLKNIVTLNDLTSTYQNKVNKIKQDLIIKIASIVATDEERNNLNKLLKQLKPISVKNKSIVKNILDNIDVSSINTNDNALTLFATLNEQIEIINAPPPSNI